MRIAYLTHDLVNLSVARELAEANGARIELLFCKDGDRNAVCEANLYDLDFLPPQERRQVVADLTDGHATTPAAVHSYHIEDDVAQALRRRGVAVHRRLDADLMGQLCDAIRLEKLQPTVEPRIGAIAAAPVPA